jgi:hypothetical protein
MLTDALNIRKLPSRRTHRPYLSSLLLFVSGFVCAPTFAAELKVPATYDTIQDAIDAAVAGDEVLVDIGTYQENLTLKSEVDVRGVEAARTFLVSANDTDETPVVRGTNVNDVLLANFTFIDSINGVTLTTSSNIILASNVFDSLAANAVTVGPFSAVEIINNVFWNNAAAVIRATSNATITNNIFELNTVTIASLAGLIDPDQEVTYNCFYQNTDLENIGQDRGTFTQIGDPLFVDIGNRDFHLQQDSPCINTGTGEDIIDITQADIGAYGGQDADPFPFPVPQPVATDTSTTGPDVYNIQLEWDANLAYLITSNVMPGSYNVYYQLNEPGPDYNGTDAEDGTNPSPINISAALIDDNDEIIYTLTDLQPDSDQPDPPILNSAGAQNESAVLNWESADGATGYRVYYGEAVVTENSIDVGNVTSYTVTGLTNGTTYIFAVSALTQPVYYLAVTALDSTLDPTHKSDHSPEVSIAIGDPVESLLPSNELEATPELVQPYPKLPDEGCFIATAAFGGDWVKEVRVLREFRDRYLLTNTPGRWFVNWYYREGPSAAAYIHQHDQLKPVVRAALWPLVLLSMFLLSTNMLIKMLTLLVFVSLAYTTRHYHLLHKLKNNFYRGSQPGI